MTAVLPSGIRCEGCGVYIFFRVENGKKKAFEAGNVAHKCPQFEEIRRLSGDNNIIQSAKTFCALANQILQSHRLELRVIDFHKENPSK